MRRPIVVTHGLVFCKEHKRQLGICRREGVNTAQLNAVWRDTLDNWRERPAGLNSETGKRKGATCLFFTQRYEDWLLFRRGYPRLISFKEFFRGIVSLLTMGKIRPDKPRGVIKNRKGRKLRSVRCKGRLGNCLVVNAQTGEIRRFVDVMEHEVLDDLRGIRPVSGQAEIAAFWGNPTPTGMREKLQEPFHQRVAPGHRLLIPELVGLVQFPLYGPVDNPFGLVLQSAGWSGGGSDEIGSVSLSFNSPHFVGPDRNFDITTARTDRYGIYYPLEDDEHYVSHLDERLFQSYHLSGERRVQVGSPEIWHGELLIDEETFISEIRSWSQPYQLARFTLKNARVNLSGQARGLARDELLPLLKELKVINQRDDTLAQYQREFDEAREKRINRTV
jgi:hypothetical protein